MTSKITWTLCALAALLSAPLTFASEPSSERFSFNFTGRWSGNFTMVSCDYAQYVTENFMTKFGATNVYVMCSGGIQPYGIYPINLNVSYDAPLVSENTRTETINIDSEVWRSNCVFDTGLMRSLLRDFKNVKATNRSDACFQSDSRYFYRLDVTLPQ